MTTHAVINPGPIRRYQRMEDLPFGSQKTQVVGGVNQRKIIPLLLA
jgi:hypothetical protein